MRMGRRIRDAETEVSKQRQADANERKEETARRVIIIIVMMVLGEETGRREWKRVLQEMLDACDVRKRK